MQEIILAFTLAFTPVGDEEKQEPIAVPLNGGGIIITKNDTPKPFNGGGIIITNQNKN